MLPLRRMRVADILPAASALATFVILSLFYKSEQLALIDPSLGNLYPLKFWLIDLVPGVLTESIWCLGFSLALTLVVNAPPRRALMLSALLSPVLLLGCLWPYPIFSQIIFGLRIGLFTVALVYFWRQSKKRTLVNWRLFAAPLLLACCVVIFYLPLFDPAALGPPDLMEYSFNFVSGKTFSFEPQLYLQEPAWGAAVAQGGYSVIYALSSHIYFAMTPLIGLIKPAATDAASLLTLFQWSFAGQLLLCALGYFILVRWVLGASDIIAVTIGATAILIPGFINRFTNEIYYGLVGFIYPWAFTFLYLALKKPVYAVVCGIACGFLLNLHWFQPEFMAIMYYNIGVLALLATIASWRQGKQLKTTLTTCTIFFACLPIANYRFLGAYIDYTLLHPNRIADDKKPYALNILTFGEGLTRFFENFYLHTHRNYFAGFFLVLLAGSGLAIFLRQQFAGKKKQTKTLLDLLSVTAAVLPPLWFLVSTYPLAKPLLKLPFPAMPGHHPARPETILHFTLLFFTATCLAQLCRTKISQILVGVVLICSVFYYFPDERRNFVIGPEYFKTLDAHSGEMAAKNDLFKRYGFGIFDPILKRAPMTNLPLALVDGIDHRQNPQTQQFFADLGLDPLASDAKQKALQIEKQSFPLSRARTNTWFVMPDYYLSDTLPIGRYRIGNMKYFPRQDGMAYPSQLELSTFFVSAANALRWYSILDYFHGVLPEHGIYYDWEITQNLSSFDADLLNYAYFGRPFPPKKGYDALDGDLKTNLTRIVRNEEHKFEILFNRTVLPRAFVYHSWTIKPFSLESKKSLYDDGRMFDGLRQLHALNRNTVLLFPVDENEVMEHAAHSAPGVDGSPLEQVVGEGTIVGNFAFFHLAPNFANRSGILFYSDMYHEDWVAFQGTKQVPVWRAQLSFKGVPITGTDPVWFEFRSKPLFFTKILMQILLIIGLIGVLSTPTGGVRL